MNILVGGFVAESNAAVKKLCGIEDFMMKTGDDVITSLYVKDIFEEANVTVIPSLYADGRGGGIVCKDAFDTIAKSILDTVRAYKYEIDGMFLFLHGASHILNLDGGSGEHYIMHEIRKIVGKHLPVAMVTDPHGNSSKELVENCTIVRSFRESPHTDRADAHRVAAKLLLEVLTNRRDIHAVYTKVPIILGGERTVSKDQPMMKINALLNEIEQDPRILSCSYQIGYVRHDSDKAGASAIVVPNSRADMAYAQQQADRIAEFAFSIRREFHFHGNAQEPDVAVATAELTNPVPYPRAAAVPTAIDVFIAASCAVISPLKTPRTLSTVVIAPTITADATPSRLPASCAILAFNEAACLLVISAFARSRQY